MFRYSSATTYQLVNTDTCGTALSREDSRQNLFICGGILYICKQSRGQRNWLISRVFYLRDKQKFIKCSSDVYKFRYYRFSFLKIRSGMLRMTNMMGCHWNGT